MCRSDKCRIASHARLVQLWLGKGGDQEPTPANLVGTATAVAFQLAWETVSKAAACGGWGVPATLELRHHALSIAAHAACRFFGKLLRTPADRRAVWPCVELATGLEARCRALRRTTGPGTVSDETAGGQRAPVRLRDGSGYQGFYRARAWGGPGFPGSTRAAA